jgi:glycerophosphoryl diester phosphodiesterase
VWAHRGDSAHHTENTIAAFEAARAVGADGVELDVCLDRDGTVVVFHDHDLQRLAGRVGRMEDLGTSERRALRVIGDHPVPTLEEAIEAIGPLELDIEIKSVRPGRMGDLVAATAAVIRRSAASERILVSSFDPIALVQLHLRTPDVAQAYLFHEEQPLPLRRGWVGAWFGASLYHPQRTLCTEASVRRWHASGLAVNAWTTDDPVELRRLAALGIDGVFCDDPGAALALFGAG